MFGKKSFHRLLEPGYLGPLRIRNRILKTGSTLGFFPWEDGHIPQKMIDAYEALAKGGAGIVTVGAAPLGVPPGRGYLMDDDKFLPGMTLRAESTMFRICGESLSATSSPAKPCTVSLKGI
jgi:2,4-dienoyl-CoA reductase-like NADH-dependent reductase (Old Yellow Enzyme family)